LIDLGRVERPRVTRGSQDRRPRLYTNAAVMPTPITRMNSIKLIERSSKQIAKCSIIINDSSLVSKDEFKHYAVFNQRFTAMLVVLMFSDGHGMPLVDTNIKYTICIYDTFYLRHTASLVVFLKPKA
jgi:hypothetical protein